MEIQWRLPGLLRLPYISTTLPPHFFFFHFAATADLRLEVEQTLRGLEGMVPGDNGKQKKGLSERLGIFHGLREPDLGPTNRNVYKEDVKFVERSHSN